MDMKKIPKPRMEDYDYERKQRREREKSERQQGQAATNREIALFSEPRRVNPSEADDDIAAKLGDYSKVKEIINLHMSMSSNRQIPSNAVITGIVPPSASIIGGGGIGLSPVPASPAAVTLTQRLPPPPPPKLQHSQLQPPHHYQQQQQLRQSATTYVKQADNKPPYNGRGGYPGQPVNRSSTGMAPPKGPPTAALLASLPTTHMPNGRQSSSSSLTEKSYVGPPSISSSISSSTTHNGRFPQPSIPKNRQKHLPSENHQLDINKIINLVTDEFCPPKMLTGIDATPHTTLMENYNLSEPNKHKYSFDISRTRSVIEPLDSPPRAEMPAPRFVPPLSANNVNASQLPSSSASASSLSSSTTYIAPANNSLMPTSAGGQQQQPSLANTATTSRSPSVPVSPIQSRPSKESLIKPSKAEKPTPPPPSLEKQNSTLENDLELSESDDDRKKQTRSALNSSDSSGTDSSESGSEDSSKSEQGHTNTLPSQQQQQQIPTALITKKKLSHGSSAALASGGNSSSSSGLGSSVGSSSATPCSSSSSSNKTPSPSNTTKWQLSRYFNKAPLHNASNQEIVSPSAATVVNSVSSMNVVSLNVPTMLPGGAQIIPEPPQQLTNIKNENLIDDRDEDDDDDDENDSEVNGADTRSGVRRNGDNNNSAKNETFPHPSLAAAAAFPTRKPPAGLSVTPLSPLLNDIKKEGSDVRASASGLTVNSTQVPVLNASEFVAIPSNQIKHETMAIAGGHTTVIPYGNESSSGTGVKNRADNYVGIEGLSGLSSDSDDDGRERLPVPGPGGILQIRGVPAAITALPRSPVILQKTQKLPNTLTVTPIDPLPSSPPSSHPRAAQQRAKKPRKKLKQQLTSAVIADTSDEEHDEQKSNHLVSPAAVTTTTTGVMGAKKGRGRPRKNATPNQSGNISSASSASASAKGPTLTAKKDVAKRTTIPATGSRRRISRQNSANLTQNALITQTKQPLPIPSPSVMTTQLLTIPDPGGPTSTVTSNDSSSSSESSSYNNSKSSSSSTDSDNELEAHAKQPAISVLSSSEDDENTALPFAAQNVMTTKSTKVAVTQEEHKRSATGPRRIVKQLNRRKSTMDDMVSGCNAPKAAPNAISMSSTSVSSSTDSSTEDYVPPNTAVAGTAIGSSGQSHATLGSSSQRSTTQLSPYKNATGASSSRSRKPTSCSSAFSSESSGDEHFDSDCGEAKKEKKLRRDKPKSDKNKISTLTRIFKTSNEGGAKKQGQVVIVDQSEEQMQQQQKHISPINNPIRSSQENLILGTHGSMQGTPTAQSPRLTPRSHMRSPRSLPLPPLAAQILTSSVNQSVASHRTPDRSTTSAERKLQQRIKTPTRTPTRTPPTTRTPTPTPVVITQQQSQPTSLPLTSLICKIDLSRLLHIPAEWHKNPYRLYGHAHSYPQSAGRTPIYDHETILNADLQSTTTQLRLKTHSSGSVTPRSAGNHTPMQMVTSERELSRSRESLQEMALTANAKRVMEDNVNVGRLSSRSADGSGDGSTPKHQVLLLPPIPNGYTAATARGYAAGPQILGSPSAGSKQLLMTGVKHEHTIKHEPDSEAYETKYKTADTNALIKQELLILKQDYKPSDLTAAVAMAEKQQAMCSPQESMHLDTKPRRKRSCSSSSSPYKEKKRKKEKDLGEKEKLILSSKDKETANEIIKSAKDSSKDTIITLANGNGQQQRDQQQLPLTNHDRLQHQQQLQKFDKVNTSSIIANSGNGNNNLNTASSAHLQSISNPNSTVPSQMNAASAVMPPPANVGLIPPPLASATVCGHSVLTRFANVPPNSTCSSNTSMASTSNSSDLISSSHRTTAAISSTTTGGIHSNDQAPQVVYRSYFERDDEAFSDDFSKDAKFLQEAVHRKHAADREQNTFNQVTLYLEAVVYFLLSGAAMEQCRSEEAAWTMYRDTLDLIKYISKKFPHLQASSANQHETHKVAILSLRCQSLISLKLYKLKRGFCRHLNYICREFFKSGKGDIVNGNTPSSISPSNSVGSQGSGSNTPPGKIVPENIHSALHQQNQIFNYLASSHELWDQADKSVRDGNHTDFFIALDHENGPLTLHSSVYEVFRYVQAGLKKLKDEMLIQ
ncbi:AF4/FMR2 family member lilli isoform X2 [Glossina fuscipes]|uniref:AF4/FMR2 family member lilli n=1 Tax=Glossina fuscipes TaxID=7396 RepID=A0A9C5ZK68_9MUSC|nr:AF4/FMR2 family member lilli isoform X2 [Glossina fuscipes]